MKSTTNQSNQIEISGQTFGAFSKCYKFFLFTVLLNLRLQCNKCTPWKLHCKKKERQQKVILKQPSNLMTVSKQDGVQKTKVSKNIENVSYK